MQIEKFNNGTLKLKVDEPGDITKLVYDDDFFMSDLGLHIASDGWKYIYDTNKGLVYSLDDYGYNHLDEILDGKEVFLTPLDEETVHELIEEFNE